jgi:hypothetical protein
VRRVKFSCFVLPDSFSAVPRASVPVFMFIEVARTGFGCPEGDGSHFHVLRVGTNLRRYRGRRVPFSCSSCLDSFPALPRASVSIIMFCAPGLVFSGMEGVE